MEDKENISYLIRRKSNNNKRETVNFSQLTDLYFDDDDPICADDGKKQWYTYKLFRETFLNVGEKESIVLEQISESDKPRVDVVADLKPEKPSGKNKKPDGEESLENVPLGRSSVSAKVKGVLIVSGFVAILTLIFIFVGPEEPSRTIDATTITLLRREMQKELMEGVSLVEKGDNMGANTRFRNVYDILSANKEMDRSDALKYVEKYNAQGDSLCVGMKTQTFFADLANEYYLYAAILSGTNKPNVCQ